MPQHPHLPPSPALLRLIKATITSPAKREMLLSTYEQCGAVLGGDLFNRGEASFNPRLCRILQILIEDCGVTDATYLCGAIKKLSSDPVLPSLESPTDHDASYLYADCLDRLRHAHFHLSNEQIETLLDFIRNLAKDRYPKVEDKITYLINRRYTTKEP